MDGWMLRTRGRAVSSVNLFGRGTATTTIDPPSIVVVDEAYIDFSEQESFLADLDKYNNLIVLQTLSKAWGLAGLRVGQAYSCEQTISTMARVKYPYNINVVTQKLVLDELKVSRSAQIKEIIEERKKLVDALSKISLVKKMYDSSANFILVEFDEPKNIYNSLIELGIIVRDRSSVVGCAGCLRISIGTPKENEMILSYLRRLDK